MDREFSLELSQREAEALNTYMPNGHSMQIFEKYERRKKAEKKLDDMYVAEFSLRPVKKVKKQSEVTNEKNTHNPHSVTKKQGNDIDKQKSTNSNNGLPIKQLNKKQKQRIERQNQKEVSHIQKQKQQTQFRTSRSQRVSRPTEAYMQFQEEAFKRKFTEKDQPIKARDHQGSMKRVQESKHMKGSKAQQSKDIVKRQQSKKVPSMRGLDMIELKSLIAQKIQKRINKSDELQKVKVSLQEKPLNPITQPPIQQQQSSISNKDIQISHIHPQQPQANKQQHQLVINQQQPHKQLSYQNIHVTKRQSQQLKYNNSLKVNQLPQSSQSSCIIVSNQQAEQMPVTRKSVQKQQQLDNLIIVDRVIVNPNQLTENQTLKVIQSNKNYKEQINKVPKVVYSLSSGKQPALTRAFRILQRLKAHKSSWPFRYPVDPVSQGVPDYWQKIKHPMDLKTIQKKLRNERYKKQDEFFSDVQLMFNNSYSYNPLSSNYYKLTCQLQTYFNELKGKSYIAKSSVRNICNKKSDGVEQQYQKDEGDDIGEANQEQQELQQQELTLEKDQLSNNKRTRPQDINKKQQQLSKVIVNNNSQVMRVENNEKVKEIKVNKISKVLDVSVLRSEQTKGKQKESEKKQQKVGIQQGKQQGGVSMKGQRGRIGYGQQWLKVPIVNRECLLYDILSLKLQQSQQQLYKFIKSNKLLMDQLMVSIPPEQQYRGNTEDSQQQVQFELGDLDMEGYKLLRQQVNKLLEQQQKITIGSSKQ